MTISKIYSFDKDIPIKHLQVSYNDSDTKISETVVTRSFDVIFEKISFTLDLKKKYYFHVKKGSNHFILRLFMGYQMDNTTLIATITQAQLYSYEEVKEKIRGVPNTEAEFLADLAKLKLIEDEIPRTEIPNKIDIGFYSFRLSQELIQNINNCRGEDHFIDINVLKACLKKVSKKLKNKDLDRIDYYIKVNERILNLVLVRRDDKNFVVLTAYYPTHNVIMNRFKFRSTVQRETWVKTLPQVIN